MPFRIRAPRFVRLDLFLFAIVLVASRLEGANEPDRTSQEVISEDVSFQHATRTLAGTLYRPAGAGPHPAVVMILGSDKHDRNYGGIGPALGRHFGRAGIACMAWDKPGVGKSTGDYNDQTLHDRAEEALAAIKFLRGRKEIRQDQIGVWGHSQGGMVAPLAASLSKDVAFLIDVSGWQGPAWQQDSVRVGAELRAAGFAEADVNQAVAFAQKRMAMIRGSASYKELEDAQNEVKALPWFKSVHFCDRVLFESARRNVELDTTSWWAKVYCPVLAIYGDSDTSTGPPEPVVAIIRDGLKTAGNMDITVRIFHDADHSILRVGKPGGAVIKTEAKKGSKGVGPDFAPGYLETMTDWLLKRVSPSNKPR